MQTTAERFDLSPPMQGRWSAPFVLALIAHALLIAALTWGVGWQTDAPQAVFEAELWSALPQQAAPRAVEPPPPPPAPKPQPVVKPAPPAPTPPAPTEADIATAQAKKKAEALEKKALEEKELKRKLAEQHEAKKAEAKKQAAAEKAAADKRAAEKQAKEAADEKRREELRKENIARMMGQAGATGGPQATGTAARSSGPSPGYAGRIAAHIRPNVVFTEPITGNPRTLVRVTTFPDGTIAKSQIVKSSGNPAWDDAVKRAIERTGSLPRDTDGTVPPDLEIGLRPQD